MTRDIGTSFSDIAKFEQTHKINESAELFEVWFDEFQNELREMSGGNLRDVLKSAYLAGAGLPNDIQELSKSTLGSYVKHATKNKAQQDNVSANARDKSKRRSKGINTAIKKLTKEEVNIQEISGSKLGAYIVKSKKSEKKADKAKDHLIGNFSKIKDKEKGKKRYNKLRDTVQKRGSGLSQALSKLQGNSSRGPGAT